MHRAEKNSIGEFQNKGQAKFPLGEVEPDISTVIGILVKMLDWEVGVGDGDWP